MIDKFLNIFKKEEPVITPKESMESKPKIKRERKSKKKAELTEKQRATEAGEPYVAILRVDIDPNNINAGSFELDWNDKFVLNLIRAGYKQREDDTDSIVVDRWFQTVCRNIALEMYEQKVADPTNRDADDLRRIQSRNIGNGRTEVS